MTGLPDVRILPYSYLVGQESLRRCLELAYVAPRVGGVLISGERGTAKSTAVRAFSRMVFGALPVTLPINATDDRVLGGWRIEALMKGRPEQQPGLLEKAGETGLLYIDEVNLLDDHLVNIILDVASTGVLVVQREGLDKPELSVNFTLVGTMNPEEGGLRPQLLDRFGLLTPVVAETSPERRHQILQTVLRFEDEMESSDSAWINSGIEQDRARRRQLDRARQTAARVLLPNGVTQMCSRIAAEFGVAGHRGEIVMALSARASAALDGREAATIEDVRDVAQYALVHRLPEAAYSDAIQWTDKNQERLDAIAEG
jgi:magnesium chelatase subunit I